MIASLLQITTSRMKACPLSDGSKAGAWSAWRRMTGMRSSAAGWRVRNFGYDSFSPSRQMSRATVAAAYALAMGKTLRSL